jgi:hypothetical protein
MAQPASSLHPRIPIDRERMAEFCRKWQITEFALFGSVLRDDFRPDSDVDVLVTFAPDAVRTLEGHLQMVEEMEALFGRHVDVNQKRLIVNPFRRHEILTTRNVIYAARQAN